MIHRFTVSLHQVGPGEHTGDARGDHLDWFFAVDPETDAPLVTWSTPIAWPAVGGQPAQRLPDHRTRYLDYDGEISGDRGRVQRLVVGTYRLLENDAETMAIAVESIAEVPSASAYFAKLAAGLSESLRRVGRIDFPSASAENGFLITRQEES
ncbi:hypothetical protein [Allorhodopirellula solitaria]|uniref:Uncharacterized protein n=1 Tax=Allorhodopirellula solitaria TaxID=2527987 RepID=A0A5C5X0A7_9BACT|nr:hypothetical protein [Allorhodopirellula solitaria]TWT56288.1 hypothetical protein CA85_42890 [Allorhodopirellula solitaria]